MALGMKQRKREREKELCTRECVTVVETTVATTSAL